MPRSVWGVIATGVAMALLAAAATPAGATTDRLDYSDRANPICASSNKQVNDLYEFVETETDRLEDLHPKSRKKAHRIARRAERLYEQLPFQFVAIYRAELEQLKLIAAPPGYEDTVDRWLRTRSEIAALYDEYLRLDRQLSSPIVRPGKKRPSRKAIKRRLKREGKLFARKRQVEDSCSTTSRWTSSSDPSWAPPIA
jgi:hypothetical protein